MHIKTKDIQITKKDFFKILLVKSFKGPAIWVMLIIVTVITVTRDGASGFSGSFTFLIYMFIILSIYYWFYVNSKKNIIFFKKRFIEFDDIFLTGHTEDGSLSKMPLDNIVKVKKLRDCYLFYIATNMFIYVPFNAFYSKEDLESFESLFRSRKLLK